MNDRQVQALADCPFCGNSNLTLTVNGTNWQIVQCDDCGACGPCVDLEGFQYIERWNTRSRTPSAPDVTAPPSAMKEALSRDDVEHIEKAFIAFRPTSDSDTEVSATILNKLRASLDAPAKEAAAPAAGGDDPLEDLVARFSAALLEKLKAARIKHDYDEGWRDNGWEADCQKHLIAHLAKGDPRDVAAYCAFMWHHGWSTVAAPPLQAPAHSDAVREAAISFLSSFHFTVCEKSFYKDAYLNITRPDKSCCYRLSNDSTASEDIAGIERRRAEILAALTAPAIKDTKPVAYRQISKSSGSASFSETQLDDTEFNRGRWTEDALYLSATPALTAPAAKAAVDREAVARDAAKESGGEPSNGKQPTMESGQSPPGPPDTHAEVKG